MKINIYKGSDLEGVRVAAQASAYVLQRLCDAVTPGMSTLDLDRLAAEFIKETGGKSAFLNYHGYPAQICCSVNEVVVHGIGRADKVINPGDIVSLDVGVTVGGFTGDNARSVIAGGVSTPLKDKLLEATRSSLEAGIAAAVPGNRVCDIGAAVEKVVKAAGFSVVRDMVGHGCGLQAAGLLARAQAGHDPRHRTDGQRRDMANHHRQGGRLDCPDGGRLPVGPF